MSSELSPSKGEFPFDFGALVRAMAPARMAASSVSRSSVVSVSAGGAKVIWSGMGSEPPEAVCSVFAGRSEGIQEKSICNSTGEQSSVAVRIHNRAGSTNGRFILLSIPSSMVISQTEYYDICY
jgi:hypothetical protein